MNENIKKLDFMIHPFDKANPIPIYPDEPEVFFQKYLKTPMSERDRLFEMKGPVFKFFMDFDITSASIPCCHDGGPYEKEDALLFLDKIRPRIEAAFLKFYKRTFPIICTYRCYFHIRKCIDYMGLHIYVPDLIVDKLTALALCHEITG